MIWEFAGEELPTGLLDDLSALDDALPGALADLLSPAEVEAVRRRARKLVKRGRFPVPNPDTHHYPWPLV